MERSPPHARILGVLAALVVAAGCKSSPLVAPQVCAPGQQVVCACPGGAPGAQACNAEGTGYDGCECPGSSSSSSGGLTTASSSSGGGTGGTSTTSASSGGGTGGTSTT